MNSTKKHTPSNSYVERNIRRLPWLAQLAPVHRPYFSAAFREPKNPITITSGDLIVRSRLKHERKPKCRKRLGKISIFLYVRFGSRAIPEMRCLNRKES